MCKLQRGLCVMWQENLSKFAIIWNINQIYRGTAEFQWGGVFGGKYPADSSTLYGRHCQWTIPEGRGKNIRTHYKKNPHVVFIRWYKDTVLGESQTDGNKILSLCRPTKVFIIFSWWLWRRWKVAFLSTTWSSYPFNKLYPELGSPFIFGSKRN